MPEAVADERAGVRDELLGRRGGDDEEVDGVGREPGVLDRGGAGLDREARGRLAGAGDAAFADAGALDDPLVAGVDAPLEVGVGESLLGERRCPSRRCRRACSGDSQPGDRLPFAEALTAVDEHADEAAAERAAHGGGRAGTVEVTRQSVRRRRSAPASTSSSGRNTPTDGAMIMRSGTPSPSPWVNSASMGYPTS